MNMHPALIKRPRGLFQLAGEWRGAMPQSGGMVEEKIHGVRAGWIGGELLTRNGDPIGGIGHIAYRLNGIERAIGQALFFDGEFLAPAGYDATLRHIGQGERAPEQGTLYLFDCMTAEEWAAGGTDRPLYQRKAQLAEWMALAPDPADEWEWRKGTRGKEPIGPAIMMIEDEWCEGAADVERMANRIWAREGEGVMIKDAEAPYRRERNNAWQKYKQADFSTRKKLR